MSSLDVLEVIVPTYKSRNLTRAFVKSFEHFSPAGMEVTFHLIENSKDVSYKELHKIGEDNKTWYHKKFYEPINSGDMEFVNVYRNFVREIVTPLMNGDDFIFQRVPTFRVHAPGNVAVGGWHRDIDYNHSEHEINFFVPFTVAFGTNTMWVESEPNKKDFSPFEADYGDAYMWNGANLLHGNKPNTTGQTRVSVDFRVMKRKHYNENESKQSISRGTKFIIGEYYDTFN